MRDLDQILRIASAAVPRDYFQLPVAGQEHPIYRERVYCYELYHQIRCQWPPGSGFTLAGEVDKAGHRLLRGGKLDRVKPDFLVHSPGDMDENFAAIEVKPSNASVASIVEDVETLEAFRDEANYERSLMWIYGERDFNALLDQLCSECRMRGVGKDVEVWVHATAGAEAQPVVKLS